MNFNSRFFLALVKETAICIFLGISQFKILHPPRGVDTGQCARQTGSLPKLS